MRECCKPGFQKSWKPGDEEMHQVQRMRKDAPGSEDEKCHNLGEGVVRKNTNANPAGLDFKV